MRKFYIYLPFIFCFFISFFLKSQTNIGFENGNTGGWTISGKGAATVLSGGNDPLFSSIPCVYSGGGSYSLRMGDNTGSSGYGTTVSQTFTVSSGNASFIYHYAVVLEDGSHTSSEQPYFEIKMYDKNNKEISCATYEVNSNTASSVGGFSSSGSYSYKNWTSILVPLDAYIGQNVTIEFVVDWCVYDVHMGYAYIDCEVAPLDLLSSSPITCGGQSITLTAPSGAQTYSWSGPNSFSGSTQIVNVTDPGTYYCTIQSKNTSGVNCTSTLDITISGNPGNPVAAFTSNNTCLGTKSQFTDQSSISGSSIASWQWDFGDGSTSSQQNPNHTYTSAGNFTVTLTVTTTEGCTAAITQIVTVSNAPTLNLTATDENCSLKDGSATVNASGGSGSYTYQWPTSPTQTTSTATSLSAGSYTVTVDDGNCTASGSVTVGSKAGPALSLSSTNEYCGAKDGSATVNASGGSGTYSYSWNTSPVQTTATASGLASGTYMVTVNDGICSTTGNVTVNASAAPTLSFSSTKENCGASDGTATVSASGGTGTFIYSWNTSPVQTSKNATGLASGTYTVTVDDGNCIVNGTVNVSSNNAPVLSLTKTDEICEGKDGKAMANVSGGSGSYTYSWNTSPTQTTSTASNLSAGTYTVTVDDGICPVSASITITTNPTPVAQFSFNSVCLNNFTNFTDLSNISSGNIVSWNWDFGSGNTSTTQSSDYLFTQSGNYPVSLSIVSDSGCTDMITQQIDVYPLPVAGFLANDICLYDAASFTDNTIINSGNIANWEWDLGDGTTSVYQTPTHNYAQEGTYNITLIATSDQGCKDTLTKQMNVFPFPTAAFSYIDVCQTDLAVFTDLSYSPTASLTNWNWDLGEGTTIMTQSPTHTYGQDGNYNVKLVITNQYGCKDSITQNLTVHPLPQNSFTVNAVCLNQFSTFTNTSSISSGSISSFAWDFGDGGLSADQSPSYAYSQAGTFNVVLTNTSDKGCIMALAKTTTVNPLPLTDFSALIVCENETTPFSDLSSISGGSIVSYQWDFGDGNSSGLQSPAHSFSQAGNYNVTLTTYSDQGCSTSIMHTASVNSNPIANFSFNNICLYDEAAFSNTSSISSGSISSYQWDFGDMNTSTIQSPIHSFTQAGNYNVSLIAFSGNNCSDTLMQNITIYSVPDASIITNNVCDKQTAGFTDASNSNGTLITSWQWDFSNGSSSTEQNPNLVFSSDGNYTAQLIVTSSDGCKDTAKSSIEIYPLPVVDYTTNNICLNEISYFSNLSYLSSGSMSYQWDFNDGNASVTQSPNHTYTNDGSYKVKLIVTTDKGCMDSITQLLTIYPLPIADFIPDKYNGCVNLDIAFTNISSITSTAIQSYYWDLGDGNTSVSAQPAYTYSVPGNYNVTLVAVSDKGCTGQTDYPITIEAYALPTANFSFSPQYVSNLNPMVEFTDLSSPDAVSWNWYLGDETVSDLQNPVHTYADSGNYTIWLVVTNQNGCIDSISDILRVNPDAILYIPNAFTPNGNGTNEYFSPKGTGILDYKMDIFDRWGNKIFTTVNLNEGWDGTKAGSPVMEDVYVYHINVRDVLDQDKTYIGRVSLIR
jgi:gliding motility-associated-like protein